MRVTEMMAAELVSLIGNDGGVTEFPIEHYDPGLIHNIEEAEWEHWAEAGCDADGVSLVGRKVNPARVEKARAKWLKEAFGLTDEHAPAASIVPPPPWA